jgi:acyl-CoA reductase-like NAD-dependent aldehyde dehydrogenase
MVIGGQPRTARSTIDVTNPATEAIAGRAPDCDRETLDEAMDSANVALGDWSADEDARREAMRSASNALWSKAAEIGAVLTAENGKPLARGVEEVYGVASWLKYFADLELPNELLPVGEGGVAEVRRRPLGVIAAIAPWNYPLVLASWKIAPALRAGNTLVLKPSPFTPLSSLLLGQAMAEFLPPGVFNVVSGGDQLGEWMCTHPTPRKVAFTGSLATGRKVAANAATDLKRVTLELGGNDAAIVLDDVDMASAAKKIFDVAFQNSGQVCVAIKRLYVPRSRYDEAIDALSTHANEAVVGDPTQSETQFGPVTNAAQYRRVLDLLDGAIAQGAAASSGGGAIAGPGYFIRPTIVRGISDGVALVDEEQFGPALPVIAYDDEDDAISRANGTPYGLGGSVWSADPDRAAQVGARLECGTAWVNTHAVLTPHIPFGGVKSSGIGVENGVHGLHEYTSVQVLHRPAP